jgi:hypothetical protein
MRSSECHLESHLLDMDVGAWVGRSSDMPDR